jgi:hypothetical protein
MNNIETVATVTASIAATIAAFVAAYYTYETQKLRKIAQNEKDLGIQPYLMLSMSNGNAMTVRNIGKGSALGVEFESFSIKTKLENEYVISYKIRERDTKGIGLNVIEVSASNIELQPICDPVWAPNDRPGTLEAVYTNKIGTDKQSELKVRYSDISGNSYSQVYILGRGNILSSAPIRIDA